VRGFQPDLQTSVKDQFQPDGSVELPFIFLSSTQPLSVKKSAEQFVRAFANGTEITINEIDEHDPMVHTSKDGKVSV
jgi:hypothetical protein